MLKLKNVKVFDLVNNKFDRFIFEFIERNEGGDYEDYEEDEIIVYNCDVRDEEWLDLDFNYDSLENYVGEGISYIDENDNLLYNVEVKDYDLIVKFKN
jgi:hypothetical protein